MGAVHFHQLIVNAAVSGVILLGLSYLWGSKSA